MLCSPLLCFIELVPAPYLMLIKVNRITFGSKPALPPGFCYAALHPEGWGASGHTKIYKRTLRGTPWCKGGHCWVGERSETMGSLCLPESYVHIKDVPMALSVAQIKSCRGPDLAHRFGDPWLTEYKFVVGCLPLEDVTRTRLWLPTYGPTLCFIQIGSSPLPLEDVSRTSHSNAPMFHRMLVPSYIQQWPLLEVCKLLNDSICCCHHLLQYSCRFWTGFIMPSLGFADYNITVEPGGGSLQSSLATTRIKNVSCKEKILLCRRGGGRP